MKTKKLFFVLSLAFLIASLSLVSAWTYGDWANKYRSGSSSYTSYSSSICGTNQRYYQGTCYKSGTVGVINGYSVQCKKGVITSYPVCGSGCYYQGTCYKSGTVGVINGYNVKCSNGKVVLY